MLEPDATIDSRLVNGRVIWLNGQHRSGFVIRDGVIYEDTEPEEDAWRTVDASGFLVLPGLIQFAEPTLTEGAQAASHGLTTALVAIGASTFDEVLQSLDSLRNSFLDYFPVWKLTGDVPGHDIQHALDAGITAFACDSAVIASRVLDTQGFLTLRMPLSLRPQIAAEGTNATVIYTSSSPSDVLLIRPTSEREFLDVEVDGGTALDDLRRLLSSKQQRLMISGTPELLNMLHQVAIREDDYHAIARMTAHRQAVAYGIGNKRGFEQGGDADFVVFDPSGDGAVIFTMTHGEILIYNDEVHTASGDGRRLSRSGS